MLCVDGWMGSRALGRYTDVPVYQGHQVYLVQPFLASSAYAVTPDLSPSTTLAVGVASCSGLYGHSAAIFDYSAKNYTSHFCDQSFERLSTCIRNNYTFTSFPLQGFSRVTLYTVRTYGSYTCSMRSANELKTAFD
jgi:hypothetical protein